MPNRAKVAKLAKEGDAAERAHMEAQRALSGREDMKRRENARSERKRTGLDSRYMPKGNV